jgi:hypothetical protein
MWRELIQTLEPEAELNEGVTDERFAPAAAALEVTLPGDLAALLAETDGVTGVYGLNLVWPLDRIVKDNLHFRSSFDDLYMSFEGLLFFADAGNGDQFAFPITAGGVGDEVFVWDHEDDSRRWYAISLRMYLEWWLSGQHPV